MFGSHPTALARAPGRINIIGEHIDYNGGGVLPMAIDRDCAAAAGVSPDGMWRVTTELDTDATFEFTPTDLRCAVDGSLHRNLPPGNWRRYAFGVLASLGNQCGWHSGQPAALQLAIASDVPVGAGLSSSAALEVSIARAVCQAWGVTPTPEQLGEACRRAEHEFVGVPCGIMDQLVCASARPGFALMIDCRRPVRTRHIPIPTDARFVVVNTGVRHALASGEYAARTRATLSAAHKMGAAWLCDVQEADLAQNAAMLTEEEARLARHCITEHARVLKSISAMEHKDLNELGRAMWESHASLRDNYRVSCPESDNAVETCRKAGALGARMTGGGFGGCTIALVADDAGVARLHEACKHFAGVFEVRSAGA